MAMAVQGIDVRDGGLRDRVSRLLAVIAALYGLLALLTVGVGAVGLFGLLGAGVDAGAAAPARLLGLPWSLVIGQPAIHDPITTLVLAASALVLNGLLLLVVARLVGGRLRPG